MIETTFELETRSEPNARYSHWGQRSRKRGSQRRPTETQCIEAFGEPPVPPLHVTVVRICPPRNKVRDTDNLVGALKAIRDGICDWLQKDDRDLRIKWDLRQENGAGFAVRIEVRGEKELPVFSELPLLAVTDMGRPV